VEIPIRTVAELVAWPGGRVQRCRSCGGRLHRARDLDGSLITFCDGDCRNAFGFPLFPSQAIVEPALPAAHPRRLVIRWFRASPGTEGAEIARTGT
jgi:hypothetical protein